MENIRQQKVSNLIKKDIALIVNKMLQNNGIMVTISKVRVTTDLQIAKVYFSIFPSEKGNEFIKEIINQRDNIRKILARKIRNQMRIIPEILFFVDDSLDYIEDIENTLKNPDNPIK